MHPVALALPQSALGFMAGRPAFDSAQAGKGGQYDGCANPPEGGLYVGGLDVGGGGKIATVKGVTVEPAERSADLTSLLQAWSRGEEDALAALAPLVHRELREMARRLLLKERADIGWQPTDLLQEAYVRLLDWQVVRWQNRAHFFATTARMMRRVLVDAARARLAAKRNPAGHVVSLDAVDVEAPDGGVDL